LETNANRIDGLSKRTAHFRKAFARGLGRKANTLEAAAIERAARLTALAEQALVDPNVSINDRVRLDGCAAKARRDMQALIGKREPARGDALERYLSAKQGETAA
jgi:hypothetical protein